MIVRACRKCRCIPTVVRLFAQALAVASHPAVAAGTAADRAGKTVVLTLECRDAGYYIGCPSAAMIGFDN